MPTMGPIHARFEGLQVETALLQTDVVIEGPAADVKGSSVSPSRVAAFRTSSR